MVQDPKSKQWFPAEVLRKSGSDRSYLLSDGQRTFRRNTQHIRERKFDVTLTNSQQAPDVLFSDPADDNRTESSVRSEESGAAEAYEQVNLDCSRDRYDEVQQGNNNSNQRYQTRSGRVVRDNKKIDYQYY